MEYAHGRQLGRVKSLTAQDSKLWRVPKYTKLRIVILKIKSK